MTFTSSSSGDARTQPRSDGWGAHGDAGSVKADSLFDLAEYWRLAVKHRLLILGVFVAAVTLGLVATLLMTPTYTASATLQIDREAARVLNVDEVAPRESMVQGEEFFQTQYGLLRSRTLAERVMESLGLASSNAFLEQMGEDPPKAEGSAAARSADRRQRVLRAIQDNLAVSPVRGSRLVIVSFDSPDPELSARVVNAFAENYIRSNLDRKFESSRYAREFLEAEIARTKARLEDSERQLVSYATRQQIINVTEPRDEEGSSRSLTASNLWSLNAALADATAARVAAEAKWRQSRATGLTTLPEVLQNPAYQRLAEERAKLSATYQQQLGIFRPEYPTMMQLKEQLDQIDREISALSIDIRRSIEGQFTVARNQEEALQSRVNTLKGEVLDLRDRSVQYNILQRELDTSRTLYDGLLQRYKEVSVTGGVAANNISIVDMAKPPLKPSKPRLLLNLMLAGLLGLALGIIAALVIEALDETLATPEDVETKLGVMTLSVIPLLPKGETPAHALEDIRSEFSEAYYSLGAALQLSTPGGIPKSMLITSSKPAEGKSTTTYAVAVNAARAGKRVLLIDGDLRNPSMHRLVGGENTQGMSTLLTGSSDLAAVVQKTSQPNLDFISCGPLPPNPAQLLAGARFAEVLKQSHELYDHVIIDGPPVLGFADSPILASAVEGTLFILEAKGTRRGQARGALRRLNTGRAQLVGVVLTKFNHKNLQYGGYDYTYDYSYGATARTKPKDG